MKVKVTYRKTYYEEEFEVDNKFKEVFIREKKNYILEDELEENLKDQIAKKREGCVDLIKIVKKDDRGEVIDCLASDVYDEFDW